MLSFQGYQIVNIEFVNNEDENTEVELGINNDHTVSYNHDDQVCISTDTVTIEDQKAPEKFRLAVTIHGEFSFEQGDDQREMHVQTYNEIFPFIRQSIASIMMTCGMPPFYIQPVQMTAENVKIADDIEGLN
ncbi:MAG: protein-export chaperone SecB [Anaerovoracaceae bacterium]|nr:protein-export chaperone SecB [Anaerovoracaceae bacterium]